MGVDHFEERLARLGATRAPTPAASAPQVEFIVVPPASQRRAGGSRAIAMVILVILVAFAGKGFVLAQTGALGLQEMRQGLASGTPWQRGLSVLLHPDPVTVLLAQQFGMREPDPTDAVRILHESGVSMIQTDAGSAPSR
jgi:hypothetical protein